MPDEPARTLTPKLRALVATDRLSRPPVGRLTARHVEDLRALIAAPSGYDESVSVARALQAVAAGAKADVAVPLLADVLGDDSLAVGDRVVAARGLATVGTPDAVAPLVAGLRERDPQLLQAVVAGLGEVGDEAALRSLVKMPAPSAAFVGQQRTFAVALIAHRLGLDGPFLPPVPEPDAPDVDDEHRVTVDLRLQSAAATAAARETLVGSAYGLRFAERSLSVDCGDSAFTVFVNAAVGGGVGSPDAVFERPLLTGIVGREYPKGLRTSPNLLVLTRPIERGRARIEVVRKDGRVAYVGTVSRDGRGVRFRVTHVEQPRTSRTLVEGRVDGRGVSLEVAWSAPRHDVPDTVRAIP